jgi:hypothetical protein
MVKRKIPSPHRESNLRTPIIQLDSNYNLNFGNRLSLDLVTGTLYVVKMRLAFR